MTYSLNSNAHNRWLSLANGTPTTGVDVNVTQWLRHLSEQLGLRTSQLYVTQATLMVTVQLFCILIKSSQTEATRGNLYINLH